MPDWHFQLLVHTLTATAPILSVPFWHFGELPRERKFLIDTKLNISSRLVKKSNLYTIKIITIDKIHEFTFNNI